MHSCYDLESSLRKRNDFQGKDGLTSVLRNLTKGSMWVDVENNVSGRGTGGSKGQLLMAVAEVGVGYTGSDGY
jgi:hypothetical protein